MKVIIPVAGAGTRLRPLTYTQPRALIPVAGKPIIDYMIDHLQKLGLNEFIFVIGYLGDKIKDFVEEKHPDLKVDFVTQEHRLGLGHAIWKAKEYVGDEEEVLIVLGDTIIEADLSKVINSEKSTLGVKKVDDPWKFGVVEYNNENAITGVVEKPKFPKSNMALVGVYRIKETKLLFESLEKLVKKEKVSHDEIHLTDAIMMMIENGIEFDSFKVDNWYDCGKVKILLETNAKLLKHKGYVSENLSTCENSSIIQPVNIAEGVAITNSIVGPNVTISENAVINHSILSNSIIGSFAKLDHIILNNSIIGSDTAVTGMGQSLNIGDNTEIDFSGQ